MQRNWFGTALFVFIVVFIIAGTLLIKWPDFQHKAELARVAARPTLLDARLTIRYDKPPIYEERYVMRNDNGASTMQYYVRGYSGKVVTITEPPSETYAVTFFFESIVADGIWQLMDKPPAGNTSVHYTLFVHQIADNRQGSRTITFTDPQYWAVMAGRQYSIHLGGKAPIPNLLTLKSTSLADPRYLKIVNAFRDFGPASLRRKIAAARRLVSRSH